MKTKMKLSEILAENLTKLMAENEYLDTLVKLAEKSGLGYGTVERVKKATVATSIDNVEAIARAFNVTVAALLSKNMEVDSVNLSSDVYDVVDAMRDIDRNGQAKMRIAALEAYELHKLHLARLRQSSLQPQLSEDEQTLVDAYRNSDKEAKELLLISAQEAVTMTIIEERSVKKSR